MSAADIWAWQDFAAEADKALEGCEPDYVSLDQAVDPDRPVWDEDAHVHWVACYAVEGGSEGWYVHVDTIPRDDRDTRRLCLLVKVWTLEHALKAAEILTRIVLPRAWGAPGTLTIESDT